MVISLEGQILFTFLLTPESENESLYQLNLSVAMALEKLFNLLAS